MKMDHLKEWLRSMEEEEDEEFVHKEGTGERWRLFLMLVQSIWELGDIPEQMAWVIVKRSWGLQRDQISQVNLKSHGGNHGWLPLGDQTP